MNIPFMKEKTLHYPGYATRINLLKECGFFSNEYIKINRIKIKQVDFTVNLLFSLCHLEENEEEFTILNIKIIGKE